MSQMFIFTLPFQVCSITDKIQPFQSGSMFTSALRNCWKIFNLVNTKDQSYGLLFCQSARLNKKGTVPEGIDWIVPLLLDEWSAIIKVLYNNYLQSKRFTSEKDLDESSESLRMDEMALLFTLHTHFALCNLDIEDIEDRVRSIIYSNSGHWNSSQIQWDLNSEYHC